MLRILIEVEQPTGDVRKLVLRPGQQLDFGSSEYAHVALRDDAALSATHFRLRADREACYLEDLDSSNGTYVNDEPVDSAVLRDGDRVMAGQSQFRVSIEGAAQTAGERSAAVPPARAAAAVVPGSLRRNGSPPGTYTVEPCPGEMAVYRGDGAKLAPAALAEKLSQDLPLYLLVDFHKLPPSDEAAENVEKSVAEKSEYLIDWLGEGVAAGMSPRFFAATDVEEWPQVLDRAWGADAVVCLFSAQDRARLLAQLRRTVRGGGDASARAIFGFCWPSVAGPLLRSSPPEATRHMTEGIDAMLLESRDDPKQWCVFGSEGLSQTLKGLGLEAEHNGHSALSDQPAPADEAT